MAIFIFLKPKIQKHMFWNYKLLVYIKIESQKIEKAVRWVEIFNNIVLHCQYS